MAGCGTSGPVVAYFSLKVIGMKYTALVSRRMGQHSAYLDDSLEVVAASYKRDKMKQCRVLIRNH